ncbi:MAG TPA: phosphoglycerate kinase [Patescibacteria group bacterium]|nr:phosphoglycerate kinase [Patescibacteria group bacterium]
MMKSLKGISSLADKRVLVRVDFNVPLAGRQIKDESKILASLPTIKYLQKKKAKVILITHLGRPEGKYDPMFSVEPVRKKLVKLLGSEVLKINTKDWELTEKQKEKIKEQIDSLTRGGVAMLENIRFAAGEQGNKKGLAKELADLGDVFVLDGFAVAHRGDASVSGLAKYLPAFPGLLLEKEIRGLEKGLKKAGKPYVAILGGAKVETKIPVIKNLLPRVSRLLVGGVIFSTYLAAQGYKIGQSQVDKGLIGLVKRLLKNKKICLPVDVIVGDQEGKRYRHVFLNNKEKNICRRSEAILDIGPATVRLFAKEIKKAKTLVWNGAMGYFEQKPYDMGTLAVARLVATHSRGSAFGIVGGGETIEAMEKVKMLEDVDLASTGGGAMLEFLGGRNLPGIQAVCSKK